MGGTINARMTVEPGQSFAVFYIGMRVNKWWKVHQWWPVARAMADMIRELEEHPELGFLSTGYSLGPNRTFELVQYWTSFDALEAYAKGEHHLHLPAWKRFNETVGSNGDVGIWHETYTITPGRYECVYQNMPPHGLGLALGLVPAEGRLRRARGRMEREAAPAEGS
jgi:hypothetical protein